MKTRYVFGFLNIIKWLYVALVFVVWLLVQDSIVFVFYIPVISWEIISTIILLDSGMPWYE